MAPSSNPPIDATPLGPIRLHELRQLAFDELTPEAKAGLHERLRADPKAQQRLQALLAELEAFEVEAEAEARSLSDAVVARLTDDVAETKPVTGAPWYGRPWAWAPTAAAVSIALLIAAPSMRASFDVDTSVRTRTKGAVEDRSPADSVGCPHGACPTLEMFIKDEDGIRPGRDGVVLHAGDWVQFRYRAAGHRYVFVVSVDGERVLSPLYPDYPGQSVAIEQHGRHVLDGSVILDDALGPERIYAFFSDQPLRYERVARALVGVVDPAQAAKVPIIGAGVAQVSILIRKVPR